jgi:polyketide cyclase/dehydrase/lipid transport protein
MTRWEPKSRRRRGVGARFKVLMRVGSIEAGGIVRITEWREDELVAWESESGIDQRGQMSVRPATGGTELHLVIEFSLDGPGSWLVEQIAARILGRNMSATLLAARRILEHERAERRVRQPPRGATGARKAGGALRAEIGT